MRAGWVWIVVLVAVAAAGVLLFGEGPGGGGGGEPTAGPAPAAGPEAGPELVGLAGQGGPAAVSVHAGRGALQGVVRRGGVAVAADVELRHVVELDPLNPLRGGFERLMIDRMLDSGLSQKPVLARTESGGDGRFRFTDLAPGIYEVRATEASGGLGFASATLPAEGARVAVDVEIPDGQAELRGRVVYADGRPYQGLVVVSSGNAFAVMMGAGGHALPGHTDAEGRFRITGLTPGRYQVSAIIPGVMRVMGAPVEVPHDGETLLTIHAAGVILRGLVVAAATNEPVPGATVFGGGGNVETSFALLSTTAGADGRFELTIPAGGNGGLFVRAKGFATQMVNFRGPPQDEQVVALLATGTISGRVTAQEGGAPVAGVPVFASSKGQQAMFGGSVNGAQTDADGRYRIEGVPPGEVHLHVLGAGWASVGLGGTGFSDAQTPYVVDVEPGASAEQDLAVVAAGRAAGHVRDAAGAPVAGAVVQPAGPDDVQQQVALLMGLGVSQGSAVTDADGAYEVDALVPGTSYKLAARAPEQPDATSATFTAAAGTTETVDITFAAARYLAVRVVEAEGGKPVQGAVLTVRPRRDEGSFVFVDEFLGGGGPSTDAQGKGRVGPLPEGPLEVTASASGFLPGKAPIDEAGTGEVLVELRRGLVLAGRVQLPEGVPVQGVTVSVRRDGRMGEWYHQRAGVSAEGTWRVDDIPSPGECRVSAEARWNERRFSGEATAEPGREDVVVELTEQAGAAARRVEIHVVDAAGEPVPSGVVELTRYYGQGGGSSNSSQARINAGKVVLEDFDTQDGELWVEVREMIGSERGATIQGPVQVVEGRLEVRLPAARQVAGLALDAAGKGVAGVRVEARPVHPRSERVRTWQGHDTAVSDAEGRFTLRGLGPLEYELDVTVPPEYAPVPNLRVGATEGQVRIALRPGASAVLTLLDYAGKPVAGAGASLQARSSPDLELGGVTSFGRSSDPVSDAQGVLRLRGLDPDATFDLTVNPPAGRDDLRPVELEGWRPADATLTFARGYVITGTVLDTRGKPVQDATLRFRKAGTEDWSWHAVESDGTFKLEHLEAGDYELRAELRGVLRMPTSAPGGREAAEPGIVRARGGATRVKVVLDLGLSLAVKVRGLPEAPAATREGMPEMVFQRNSPAWLQAEGDGGGTRIGGQWRARDRVEFVGLEPGRTYRLWISGLAGGRYVRAGGLRAQDDLLEIDSRAGGKIAGRLRCPAGVTLQQANVSCGRPDGTSVNGTVDTATGRFELLGVPEGEWKVSAFGWAGAGQRNLHGEAQASTGQDVEIELTPD